MSRARDHDEHVAQPRQDPQRFFVAGAFDQADIEFEGGDRRAWLLCVETGIGSLQLPQQSRPDEISSAPRTHPFDLNVGQRQNGWRNVHQGAASALRADLNHAGGLEPMHGDERVRNEKSPRS